MSNSTVDEVASQVSGIKITSQTKGPSEEISAEQRYDRGEYNKEEIEPEKEVTNDLNYDRPQNPDGPTEENGCCERRVIDNKYHGSELRKDPSELPSEKGEESSHTDAKGTNEGLSFLQKALKSGLVNTSESIEVMRKNPNSPLYSIKSFESLRLKPELLKGVYAMGFNTPSKIQETTVPTLLADPPQNMIAQSQSGTGKTAAFVLAMLSRINPELHYPQALCLSPTFELAIQTAEVVAYMAKYCPEIKIRLAVKGEQLPHRGERLTDHIVIGTPGKVGDWVFKFRTFDMSELIVFVLDEADVMISMQGHQDQSLRLRKRLSSKCQIMLFSATYDDDVMEFAEMMVPDPVILRLRREEESLKNIRQYYVKCKDSDTKYDAVTNIYGGVTIGQAIIFCHSKKTANWLSEKMKDDGHSVGLLTGDLTVDERMDVLDRFKSGTYKVLITTNVLSRGIDIEQVTIVVNFDLPVDQMGRVDCETYLHRIGRTGRFGKTGLAINLIDSDLSYRQLLRIQEHFKVDIPLLDTEDVDELENLNS